MNIKKDFYPFSFIKVFILQFFRIHFSLTIDLYSSCDENQYYSLTNFTCLNCPDNSISDSLKFTCHCNNMSEYFNSTTVSCKTCEENFGLNSEKNDCINCSNINSTNEENYDKENYRCQCGNSSVLFYKNKNNSYNCKNDSLNYNDKKYPNFNHSLVNVYENDTDNVCIGIGYYYNSTNNRCECINNTYDLITYKVNSSFSINICVPNITKSNSTRRRMQSTSTSTSPILFGENGATKTITIEQSTLSELIQNNYTKCISTLSYPYSPEYYSCNMLANLCVLTLYSQCDQYNEFWNSAENIEE